MSGELSDLLRRLRQGDEAAAVLLVAAYEPHLRRVVRRSLPDRIRARFDSVDVIQSVWVHVLGGLRAGRWRFADEPHYRAFLLKVARRRLFSRMRRHCR